MSLRTRFVLPIIAFAFSILAGCGGSGSNTPVAPPGGGFSNSNLKGTYVFSFSGTDTVNNTFFSAVGMFVADGNGGITSGTFDIDDSGATAVTIGSGSGYAVTADGRGRGTFMTNNSGTLGFDFVLSSNSHGMIMRFDQGGTGSGTLDLQDSTVTQASLTTYAFALSGVDSSGNPLVTEGTFALGGSTTISAGLQDFNDNNNSTSLTGLGLTGSVAIGTNGPGTATLTTTSGFGSLTFDVWTIDATHLKLIETDGVELMTGDAFTQQATLSSSTLVYTFTGLDSANPRGLFAAGGYFSYDGNVTIASGGLEDINDAGAVGQSTIVGGSLTASGTGRYLLVLNGFDNGANGSSSYSFVGYPFTAGGATGILLMETDGLGVTSGTAMVQTAQTFTTGQGYGLNLTGANQGGEVDDIAEFTANSGGTVSNGIIDENDENAGSTGEILAFKQGLGNGGTYTFDSPATGRGVLAYPNTSSTFNGSLGLAFYVANSSTVMFIEGDSGQVGVGAFQLQSSSAASQAAVSHTQEHLSMLRAVSHSRTRKRQ